MVARDVSDRKRVEEALRDSEAKFSTVFRDSPVAIGISRLADGKFLDVNDAFVRLHGYAREELLGHTSEELGLWHSDNRSAVLQRMREENRSQVVEMQARCRNGDLRNLLASITRIRLGGEPCMVGFLSDITERKRMEAALREGELRYRAVVEDQTEVLSRFKADGTITFVNDVFCRFFGQPREELIGRRWQPRAVAEDLPMIEARLRTLTPADPVVVIENRVHAADGALHWMEFVNRAFFDPAGRLVEMQSVGRDITERKRLEAERSEALTRLAVIEEQERLRLSRELHDQTAQRLVALAVGLKNLESDLAAGKPLAGQVRSLRTAVDDLEGQVRQIAWDLRAGELVADGLERALREYVDQWSERSGVTVDYECRGLDGPPLPALPEGTLYRVAQEALTNVERHARARHVSVILERTGAVLRLTVEDDGRGFDPEAAPSRAESGQRLGLLGMKERVGLAGGTLVLESAPGSGTTVLVRIPVPAGTRP